MSVIKRFEEIMTYEKSTKNTHRFHTENNGQPPRIGTLYVQQWAFTGNQPPKKIKVTVEEIEAHYYSP